MTIGAVSPFLDDLAQARAALPRIGWRRHVYACEAAREAQWCNAGAGAFLRCLLTELMG